MKILFTSTQHTSFITQDCDILRNHFVVKDLITRGMFAPLSILIHIIRADVTYTWFASVYSGIVVFLARLLGKRSVVVVGGADVAKVPEMGYGIWLSPWKAPVVSYALRNAWRVLAVDETLKTKATELAEYSGENILCLPTGFDSQVWFPAGDREGSVLTIAKCDSMARMKIKGIEILLESARLLPEIRFRIVGLSQHVIQDFRVDIPPNVKCLPFVDQLELIVYYRRARVYCQPSFLEGFPNSVCEAMLCGCIPVGTSVGGIPTAIGDSGFLVPHGNVQRLVEAIQNALQAPDSLGQSARERIARKFTLKGREEALVRILTEAAG